MGGGPGMWERSWGRRQDPGPWARVRGLSAGSRQEAAERGQLPASQAELRLLLSRRPVLLPGTLLEHGGGAGRRHPEAQVGSCMPCPAHQCTWEEGREGQEARFSSPPGSPRPGMLGSAPIPESPQVVPLGFVPPSCPFVCCPQGAGGRLAGLDGGHEERGPVGRAGRP